MRFAAVILALASASIIYRADALAIGEIEVRTMLNEPLDARVPLVAVSPEELSTLVVSPASVAAYETAGLELTGYVADLDFEVVQATPPFVRIRGQRPAREPFLDLLLEFSWGSGRLLRNYTILLDPPAVAFEPVAQADTAASDASGPTVSPSDVTPTAPSRATARSSQSGSTPAPATDPAFNEGVGWVDSTKPAPATPAAPPEPELIAPRRTTPAETVRRYGPVQSKETLWSIAFRLRPDPALTMSQMQLAIFLANPEAFDGNINTLRSGAMLHVPSAADVASLDALEAKEEIARQRQSYRSRARTAVERPRPPAPRAEPPVVTEPEPAQPAAETAAAEPVEPPIEQSVAPTDEPPAAASEVDEPAPVEATDAEPTSSAEADLSAEPEEAPADESAPQRPMTALERLRAQQAGQPVPGRPEPQQPILGQETSSEATVDSTSPPSDDAAEDAEAPNGEGEAAPVSRPAAPAQAPVDDDGGFPWLILLLALVAGGGVGYMIWKRRQTQTVATPTWPSAKEAATEAPADPGDTTVSEEPVAADEQPATLDATTSLDANETAAELAEGMEPDPEALGLEATTVFDAGAETATDTGGPVETPASESTQQFHSETIMIDVSGDDPVAEADFHLAYGLYDEAALLLQQAMESDPGRADIKSKLAEVYFAASQPSEFVELARRVQPELAESAPAEWNRIVIMGQQIAPDEPLFQSSDAADLGDGLDLDFDSEPSAAPDPATDFDLGAFDDPTEQPASEVSADDSDDDMSLEFDLEPATPAAESDAAEEVTETSAAMPGDDEHSLEFTLDATDDDAVVPPAESVEAADNLSAAAETEEQDAEPSTESTDALAFDIDTMTSEEPLLADGDADAMLDELGDFEIGEPVAEASDTDTDADADADADAEEAVASDAQVIDEDDAVGDSSTETPAALDDLIGDTDLAELEAEADDPAEFDFGDFGVPTSEPAEDKATEAAAEPFQSDDEASSPTGEDAAEDSAPDDAEALLADLDDFAAEPEEVQGADPQPAETPSTPTDDAQDELAVDLSEFDLDAGDSETDVAALESVEAGEGELDLSEFDFGVSDTPEPVDEAADASEDSLDLDGLFDEESASGDGQAEDLGSKLDLARAYVDMGDAEMATSLLDDVLAGGSEEQKAEATELKAQLAGQG